MKQKGNILIILLILAVLAVGTIVYYKSKTTTSPTSSNNIYKSPTTTSQPVSTTSAEQTKIFQSKNLKFHIELPTQFTATDEPTRITVKSALGQIYINRNGTQFDNLDGYLADFDKRTDLKTEVDEKLVINGNQARSRIFTNSDVENGKEKIYFIYSDNFVYKISTTSEALLNDLDKIAKSFRYIP